MMGAHEAGSPQAELAAEHWSIDLHQGAAPPMMNT
jgi:hypothetical protein